MTLLRSYYRKSEIRNRQIIPLCNTPCQRDRIGAALAGITGMSTPVLIISLLKAAETVKNGHFLKTVIAVNSYLDKICKFQTAHICY